MGDGAADTTGGGTLEVVHEVVILGAGGGHGGGVVGLHGWTIQVGENSSKKIVVACKSKAALARRARRAKKSMADKTAKRGNVRRIGARRISPVFSFCDLSQRKRCGASFVPI